MNPVGLGALAGAGLAVGVLLLVYGSPLMHRLRLQDRLQPYLGSVPPPSALLRPDKALRTSLPGAAARIAAPALTSLARRLDQIIGGSVSVRRRLQALGRSSSVEDFRVEQVIWGVGGALAGGVLGGLLSVVAGRNPAAPAVLMVLVGAVIGALGRDWWLTAQVRRREQAILSEFPVVTELLALAVTAGEPPAAALERVTTLVGGELGRELAMALGETRAGATLPVALQTVADRTSLTVLARFVDGVVIALERGTPLAEVLRAQASDVREFRRRELLAAGGRKEIGMLIPVVFLVLPITVMFALYPGLVNLTLLTG